MKKVHPLNKYFDKIFVISLINSHQRRNSILNRFKKLGIDFEFYDAVKCTELFSNFLDLYNRKNITTDFTFPNEIGCTISHYGLIKLAKENKYTSILIFEDDVVFKKNFNNIISDYLKVIPKDWDMLYLYSGIYFWRDGYKFLDKDERIFKSFDVNGCVAYALKNTTFDYIIDNLDYNLRIIDNFYSRVLQKSELFNIYSFFPNLCGPENTISTIRENIQENMFSKICTFEKYNENDYE